MLESLDQNNLAGNTLILVTSDNGAVGRPANGKRELYNLQADLGEANDVAETNPEVVGQLATLMNKYISEGRSTAGTAQRNDAPMSVGEPAGCKGRKRKNKRARDLPSQ